MIININNLNKKYKNLNIIRIIIYKGFGNFVSEYLEKQNFSAGCGFSYKKEKFKYKAKNIVYMTGKIVFPNRTTVSTTSTTTTTA